MAVRIEFDLMDVTFLRDAAKAQIKKIAEKINEIENKKKDVLDDLALDLCKSRLSKWEFIYNKCQKALVRKGWDQKKTNWL